MNKIFWAGDSTVAYNNITTYPQTGIGQVMHMYLNQNVVVYDYAVNGRSTKSFIDEGRLKQITDAIEEDDYLFIQFGHNDEKEQDPARYTDSSTTFRDNLRLFISEARSHGAKPLLITPLERRKFDCEQAVINDDRPQDATASAQQPSETQSAGSCSSGTDCSDARSLTSLSGAETSPQIIPTHGDYPAAVMAVAAETGTPCIDLNSKSRALMNLLGPQKTKELFLHTAPMDPRYPAFPNGRSDNSHLQYHGAITFAGIIADGLRDIYPEILLG